MTMTTTNIDTVERITRHTDARAIALAAYDSLIGDLETLSPEDWIASTVCEPWTVADMVRHLLGAAKGNASFREMVRQQAHGARHKQEHDGNALDATNALQVEDHAELEPDALVRELRAIAARSVDGRLGRPGLMRRVNIKLDAGGSTADGMPERLNLGELFDVIYTRDVWLHRIDIARAVGRDLELDPHVDGRIVADVVKEWADRHGSSFDLTLTGAGGGHYVRRGDGPSITMDAIDFCWILSGRGEPDPQAPRSDLLGWRVLF